MGSKGLTLFPDANTKLYQGYVISLTFEDTYDRFGPITDTTTKPFKDYTWECMNLAEFDPGPSIASKNSCHQGCYWMVLE